MLFIRLLEYPAHTTSGPTFSLDQPESGPRDHIVQQWVYIRKVYYFKSAYIN